MDSDVMVVDVLTAAGMRSAVLGEEDRRLAQAHLRAVLDYVEYAETEPLNVVQSKILARHGSLMLGDVEPVFDLYVVRRLAAQGSIDYESIYES